MKKIYFIRRNKTIFGGAENYLSRLVTTLKKDQIDCELIYGNLPKWLPSWLKALLFNFKVNRIKKDKFYFSLERISHPDIYRAGDGVHKVYMKIKQSYLNPTNWVYCFLEKRCFNNAKLIIANSHFIKKQLIETYHINPNKIKIIYNGIKLKPYDHNQAKQKLLSEFPQINNKKILLFIGNDFKRKGVDIFLTILSQLKSDQFHGFIIGKDKKIAHYKELAKKLKLENHVTFTGLRSDVDDFYTLSDIFLFPPRYEPFSNVVLEALSFKNVTFTSNNNGASEALTDPSYIITDTNHHEISEKIDLLLTDEMLLTKEKERAFEQVKNFTIEKNAKETIDAILPFLNN